MSGYKDKPLRLYCSICMGYHPTQAMRVLRCGHVFCEQAILEYWLTKKRKSAPHRPPPLTCPMCQGSVEHRRDARFDPGMREEAWLEKCKLLLRKLFLDSVCCVSHDDEGETVFLDDADATSQLPVGTSKANATAGYGAEVLAKAKDVSVLFKSIDKSIDSKAVQRATDGLRQMYEMMDWEAQDPILDLFGALHGFLANSVVRAFKMVAEKEKQLRLKNQQLKEMEKVHEQLQSEANQQQRLLDQSEATASQAWTKVRELSSILEGLQEVRESDKRKIKELGESGQIAKTTEAKLRKRLAMRDERVSDLENQLASLQDAAEKQQQRREDLQRQSGYQSLYDKPEDGSSEFVQGSSQDNYFFTEDIDLDSQSSDSYSPARIFHTPPPPPKRENASVLRLNVPPPPKFPSALSSWNLPPKALAGLGSKRKRLDSSVPRGTRVDAGNGSHTKGEVGGGGVANKRFMGVRLDHNGRPTGPVQLGSRTPMNRYN